MNINSAIKSGLILLLQICIFTPCDFYQLYLPSSQVEEKLLFITLHYANFMKWSENNEMGNFSYLIGILHAWNHEW